MANLANNEKIWENLRDIFPHPYTEKDARWFIDKTMSESPQVTFGIEFDGELCGVIGLVPQKDVHKKCAEIGYWLGEEYWGKGIATKAVELITRYGLQNLGFLRLHTGIYGNNKASMRVLEKNGYKKEGIFRKAIFKNNRILDEHRYAIVKDDLG